MKITFTEQRFVFKVPYSARTVPRDAGFNWSSGSKCWYTKNPGVAAKFPQYLDELAKIQIAKFMIEVKEWTRGLAVPEDQRLYPFQETATRFALARSKSYLGLDPGLGKTPIAAVTAATLKASVIYICPPFLARNTEVEFLKWAPSLRTSRFGQEMQFNGPEVVIIPDTMITKAHVTDFIEAFAHWHQVKGREVMLVVDEAHRFKNDSAGRTKAVFGTRHEPGLARHFKRIVYMSGTPMPNRPIELYPVLSHSAPETIEFRNKFEYGRKFCAGHQNQWGWDFTGSSNIGLLHSNVIGSFMLRYRKSEVLKELPPKTEEMVLIGDDLPPKLANIDRDILKAVSPQDLIKKKISLKLRAADAEGDPAEVHLMTYRRELGLLKVKPALEFINFTLEDTDESVLIFAQHTDVIRGLKEGLEAYDPIVITGATPMADRHELVSDFQSNPRRRVFIGNIQAAGVGLTLTKATRVLFVEFSWVPADNNQAADRAHRIGQDGNVHVQYLVYKNSIDRAVIETILKKQTTIGKFDNGVSL